MPKILTVIALLVATPLARAACEDMLLRRPLETLVHLRPADEVTIVSAEVTFNHAIEADLAEAWRKHAHQYGVRILNASYRAQSDGTLRLRFDVKGRTSMIANAANYFEDRPIVWSEAPRSIAHLSGREILNLLEQPIASFHFPFANATQKFITREKLATLGHLVALRPGPAEKMSEKTIRVYADLEKHLNFVGLKIGFGTPDLDPTRATELRQTRLLDLHLPANIKNKLAPSGIDTPERYLSMSKDELKKRDLDRDDRRIIKATLRTYGIL